MLIRILQLAPQGRSVSRRKLLDRDIDEILSWISRTKNDFAIFPFTSDSPVFIALARGRMADVAVDTHHGQIIWNYLQEIVASTLSAHRFARMAEGSIG